MKWEDQRLTLLGLLSLVLGLVSFVLGIAVGASQSLQDFQSTLIPVLSMIGTWVASIATVGAIWVALWLAESERRSDVESIKSECSFVLIPGISDELLMVKATADGKRPTRLNSLTFLSPHATHALRAIKFHPAGDALPLSLIYGESATFILDQGFIDSLFDYISVYCGGNAKGLKVVVGSTIKPYEIEVPAEIQSLLEGKSRER